MSRSHNDRTSAILNERSYNDDPTSTIRIFDDSVDYYVRNENVHMIYNITYMYTYEKVPSISTLGTILLTRARLILYVQKFEASYILVISFLSVWHPRRSDQPIVIMI